MKAACLIFTLLIFLCVGFSACKKQKKTVSGTVTTVNIIDKYTGTYIGTNKYRSKTTTGSGTYQDSSIHTDTFIVTKISADSFRLSKPVWDISAQGFKYDASCTYTRKTGSAAFNDQLDEITIVFDYTGDSISVRKHYVAVSSQITENWEEFSARR